MVRAEVLQEIRVMRFEEIRDRFARGRLSSSEAAEWLGVSERTFRRWRERYAAEGAAGLLDRRLGKVSAHRIGADEVDRVVRLYRERYAGWTVKHFHERARERHGVTASYGWTKSVLQAARLVVPAAKRSAHRKKRPRRPLPGLLVHQDASRHLWLPALGRQIDLVVTMDDATSEIWSAFFVEEEGTGSSFRGLAETIGRQGLFCALYTDRGSHYAHTPKAGEAPSRRVAVTRCRSSPRGCAAGADDELVPGRGSGRSRPRAPRAASGRGRRLY
jgi:transposase